MLCHELKPADRMEVASQVARVSEKSLVSVNIQYKHSNCLTLCMQHAALTAQSQFLSQSRIISINLVLLSLSIVHLVR